MKTTDKILHFLIDEPEKPKEKKLKEEEYRSCPFTMYGMGVNTNEYCLNETCRFYNTKQKQCNFTLLFKQVIK